MKGIEAKKIIIPSAVAAVVFIGVVIAVFFILSGTKKEYRIVKVYESEGDVTVTRGESGDISAYENMILETGDYVKVGKGLLTLKLDDDKYIYAEQNTEFELLVSGNATNSKTTINLVSGALTNDIQNKLSDESYYEVNTPNSTMSVRGTVPRVVVYEKDGIFYTDYQVFEGDVEIRLKDPNGVLMDKSTTLHEDMQVTVYTNDVVTDFLSEPVTINKDEILSDIVLKKLLQEVLNLTPETKEEKIKQIEKWLGTSEEDAKVTVTYKYNGAVFATQKVEKGEKATKPLLQPAETGKWEYDFDTPVENDVVIDWK